MKLRTTAPPSEWPVNMILYDGCAARAALTAFSTAFRVSSHATEKPACSSQPGTKSQGTLMNVRLYLRLLV